MRANIQDKAKAAEWAQHVMDCPSDYLILDTETTGLDDKAEICQIAILSGGGYTILDALVKPTIAIPGDASKVHGITDQMVEWCPSICSILEGYWGLLASKTLLAYNSSYDSRLIEQSLRAWYGGKLMLPLMEWQDVMAWYSKFLQVWNFRKDDYKWHKLPQNGQAHDALSDCRATLDLIRSMAEIDQLVPVSSC